MKVLFAILALMAVAAAKTTPKARTSGIAEVTEVLCDSACKSALAMPYEHPKTIKTKMKTKTKTVSTSVWEPVWYTALDLGPGTAFPPHIPSPDCTETETIAGVAHPAVVTPLPTTQAKSQKKHSTWQPTSSHYEEQPAVTSTSVSWRDCGTCALYWTTAESTYVPTVTVANPTDHTYTITQMSCLPIAETEDVDANVEVMSTELPEPYPA